MSNGIFSFNVLSERVDPKELERQISLFADGALNRHLLDAVPSPLMILNRHQQIVYANQQLLSLVSAGEESEVHGLRPGEVLDCSFVNNAGNGCGTGEACKSCGALLAALSGCAGRKSEEECCLTRTRQGLHMEALDLRVQTTPITFAGETFTVFALDDISHEKRRRVLERMFFHDILNVAGSIRGFAEFLLNHTPPNREEIYALIQTGAEQVIEEIETQRLLSAAENKELQVRLESFRLSDFLETTVNLYSQHEVAREKVLQLAPDPPDIHLSSDPTLLRRVLGNTIKNALEACSPGEIVTVGCDLIEDRVCFKVHNPGEIPSQIRPKIFQRSFSTKGPGRGLGTYSLRLLSEFLHSDVAFTTCAEKGTIFSIHHPVTMPECPAG